MMIRIVLLLALIFSTSIGWSQDKDEGRLNSATFSGFKMRTIGPAFMSGRIADIAIHPEDNNLWYVAVGSGGVWKTTNAGTSWESIFDGQKSYSIGSITIDPSNAHTIWVGSGENVGGRHVGYGDGIYRSRDGGASWENMGLKESERISKIIVHPDNSDIIWVAAQGPLWNKGGERGLYKSTDGGKSWNRTLVSDEGDDLWTGVTDLVIDPRNPDVLYAATWQRHRTVAAYVGGGPNTGLHRSIDGGETWEKLSGGLPSGNLGKIGLAISPQNPDVLYAAIELNQRMGAVYRSSNRGSSWEKRSDTISGGTGPHYYQELVASPHAFDRIYLMDVRIQISDDGGSNFRVMDEVHKHSDNHALVFRDDDPDYLLAGTDGGLYESFDLAQNWRYVSNLPITQFYKIAVDDAEPFYQVYGGTQDNNTQGAPSRTDTLHGVQNSDWEVVLFADGHQPATEPGNPDIMYAEWQQGNLVRVDRTTGELVYIQPQPEAGEPAERFNWDAPILVSAHDPKRIYFGSQRVWRSDDRGDSWRAISGDLTRNQERITLEVMDREWSWDAPWDMLAMSTYNTVTSLAESPITDGILYAGTDDGFIQVSSNGGESWTSTPVGDLPGVPNTAFVNDIKADLYDADTVYVALDNHKYGDFTPYLLKSTNRGRSWSSIASNLPERHLVWRLVQDHVKPELLFLGTEFGIFFSINSGGDWVQLTGDVPTISFRDLAIQRREDDLVGGSFGRGIWILDDYSPLRDVSESQLEAEATLFDTRKALWYIQRGTLGFGAKGSQGESLYTAPNPPYGAVFTYYLADGYKTAKQVRTESEKDLIKEGENVPFPGWDAVEAERRQTSPTMVLTVRDTDGNVVRRLEGPANKGFHRIAWDLRYPATDAIGGGGGFFGPPQGHLVAPGSYTVELAKQIDGEITQLASARPFDVERMRNGALAGAAPEATVDFWAQLGAMQGKLGAASLVLENSREKLGNLKTALSRSEAAPGDLDTQIHQLEQQLFAIEEQLNGNQSKGQVGEKTAPTVGSRLGVAAIGTSFSTYGPTPTHRRSLEIAEQEFAGISDQLKTISEQRIPALERQLKALGAPWTPGSPLPEN